MVDDVVAGLIPDVKCGGGSVMECPSEQHTLCCCVSGFIAMSCELYQLTYVRNSRPMLHIIIHMRATVGCARTAISMPVPAQILCMGF